MSSGTFSNQSEHHQALISRMFEHSIPTADYQAVLSELGRELAKEVSSQIPVINGQQDLCLACTVEDADYLAKGMIEVFEKDRPDIDLKLACFWNQPSIDPHDFEDCDISPVIKTYKEAPLKANCTVVVVKSIISGACVVATNLMHLISDLEPINIFVVAPVMHTYSKDRLQKSFAPETAKLFKYVSFAIVDKSDRTVSVYQHYGWKDAADKNKALPEIVKSRRRKLAFA